MTTSLRLSVILLAFNEEENLVTAVDDILTFLDSLPGEHEVILVDDGSTDGTALLGSKLAQLYPPIRYFRHPHNQGMGAGMRTGISHARGEYFTIIGADGQIPPDQIGILIPELDRADFVVSIYDGRRDGMVRKLLSLGMRGLMRVVVGSMVPLEGLYLFPTRVAREEIGLALLPCDTFFFSFDLLYRAVQLGYRYQVVTIQCIPRQAGHSKVANPRRIARVAMEIFKLRWRLLRVTAVKSGRISR